MRYRSCLALPAIIVLLKLAAAGVAQEETSKPVLKGQGAKGDWTTDAPGVRRLITVNDLPPPGATKSVDRGPKLVARPEGAMP
jgi:hypothetical protein